MSRRLGLSLGINLLPADFKLCNFDCIYCECGWSGFKNKASWAFHSSGKVKKLLEAELKHLQYKNISPDAITFAGNGEPSMHPEFSKIMDDTIELRDQYFPGAKVSVLTNATMLNKKSIVDSMKRADMRIFKLDAGTEELFRKINQPNSRRSLEWIVNHLQYFNGDLIVQTMFMKGKHNACYIDNTSEENINAWLTLLGTIKPKQAMLYSLDRATAEGELEKISIDKLHEIAAKVKSLGIPTMVS